MRDKLPSKEAVDRLREQYPAGTRIELLSMEDPYSKLRPGDKGSVSDIDSTGTIFVDWDSGSGLGLVYGVDQYRKATEHIQETGAAAIDGAVTDDLADRLKKATEYIISNGAVDTTSGNYIFRVGSIPTDILTPEEFVANMQAIAELAEFYEAVTDVDISDGTIDVNFYLDYCPNYEPWYEELAQFPDDREILDPLTNEPLIRETDSPTEAIQPNEAEQNFAAWLAVTESSRYKWVEDEIYRLNGRGAMYYTGGEDGVYIRISKDGTLEAGSYEGAVPHIGEAMFRPAATRQYDNYSAAFTAAMEAGGKRFLADMFSADIPQPVAGVPGKTASDMRQSVLQRIRDAEKAPKPPRKEKAPDQCKRRNGEER